MVNTSASSTEGQGSIPCAPFSLDAIILPFPSPSSGRNAMTNISASLQDAVIMECANARNCYANQRSDAVGNVRRGAI